jgi:hypothetical protein
MLALKCYRAHEYKPAVQLTYQPGSIIICMDRKRGTMVCSVIFRPNLLAFKLHHLELNLGQPSIDSTLRTSASASLRTSASASTAYICFCLYLFGLFNLNENRGIKAIVPCLANLVISSSKYGFDDMTVCRHDDIT